MTTTNQEAEFVTRFPDGIEVGTPAFNKIAAMNSMFDFITKGDPTCVDRYFKEPYFNHNMRAPNGLEVVRSMAERGVGWRSQHAIIRRVLAEGDLVLLHSLYSDLMGIKSQRVALDLFLFNGGKIVEHWDALEYAAVPDSSGLSQIDGSVDIHDVGQEEANRATVLRFIDTVLIGGETSRVVEFIDTQAYVCHSMQRAPGLVREYGRFTGAVEAAQAVYMAHHITLAEGNFVFVQGEGRIGDTQVLEVYDLFRLAHGKIVEHWDVLQALAPEAEWANPNGPFGFAKRA
jgi:predicted SnoaL-like aldol condensation-catalyzing enzyme